jgi:hypothetical protein
MSQIVDALIVGAGAAGCFAAIHAKQVCPNARIVVIESAAKPLGKVRISGGGRCNVTHACYDPSVLIEAYPRGSRELRSVFSRFACADTIQWFEARGVKLKTESDGRIFPCSDSSQSIIDALRREMQQLDIPVLTEQPIDRIIKTDHGYLLETVRKPNQWTTRMLLVATGSNRNIWQQLIQLGHTLIPPVPSLFTFNIQHPLLQDLAGTSFKTVDLTLKTPQHPEHPKAKKLHMTGPLLITHWGLSGPVVLKLSAFGARQLYESGYQATVICDFLPQWDEDALVTRLKSVFANNPKTLGNACPLEELTHRFWLKLLDGLELDHAMVAKTLPQKSILHMARHLKDMPFKIQGKSTFKDEFVTAGGVALKEINFKTMESKRCPNLYLAGEILDIDALTGGFNLQNAWSTGFVAGRALGQALKEPFN